MNKSNSSWFVLLKKPFFRNWRITTVIFTLLTFVMPIVSWAFDGTMYTPANMAVAPVVHQGLQLGFPKQFGTIDKTYQGKNKTVVVMDDLHCNYEVQMNIARMIKYLVIHHGLSLVGEEGAFGTVDVSSMRNYKNKHVRKLVTDYFVKQGKITGAEYEAICGRKPIRLEGIESEPLYRADEKAVHSFLNSESMGYVYDLRDRLNQLKADIYTPELKSFDARHEAYRRGNMDLLHYALFLNETAGKKGISLAAFPQINQYLHNNSNNFSANIKEDELYEQMDQLDQQLRESMYTKDIQRELDKRYHQVDVMEKLLNISATPGELAEFRTQRKEYSVKRFVDFINQEAGANGRSPLIDGVDFYALDNYLKQVADFYKIADERSHAFVDSISAKMERYHDTLALIVTGGFHKDKVLEELKRQDISYMEVTPQLTKLDVVNPYFDILEGRKTPLEQLLEKNQSIFANKSNFPSTANLQPLQKLFQKLSALMLDTVHDGETQGSGVYQPEKALAAVVYRATSKAADVLGKTQALMKARIGNFRYWLGNEKSVPEGIAQDLRTPNPLVAAWNEFRANSVRMLAFFGGTAGLWLFLQRVQLPTLSMNNLQVLMTSNWSGSVAVVMLLIGMAMLIYHMHAKEKKQQTAHRGFGGALALAFTLITSTVNAQWSWTGNAAYQGFWTSGAQSSWSTEQLPFPAGKSAWSWPNNPWSGTNQETVSPPDTSTSDDGQINGSPVFTYQVPGSENIFQYNQFDGSVSISYRGLNGQMQTAEAKLNGKEQELVNQIIFNGDDYRQIRIRMTPDGKVRYEYRSNPRTGFRTMLFDPAHHMVADQFYVGNNSSPDQYLLVYDESGEYRYAVDFRDLPSGQGEVNATVFDQDGNVLGNRTLPASADSESGTVLVVLAEEKMIMEFDQNDVVVNIYPLITYQVPGLDRVIVSSQPEGRSWIRYQGLDGQEQTVLALPNGKEQVLVNEKTTQENGVTEQLVLTMTPDGKVRYEYRSNPRTGFRTVLFDPAHHMVADQFYVGNNSSPDQYLLVYDESGEYRYAVDFRDLPSGQREVNATVFDPDGNVLGNRTLPASADSESGTVLVVLAKEKMIMEFDQNDVVVNIYPLITYQVPGLDRVIVSSQPKGRSWIRYQGLDGQEQTVLALPNGKEQVLVNEKTTQENGVTEQLVLTMTPDGNIRSEVSSNPRTKFQSLLFKPSLGVVVEDHYQGNNPDADHYVHIYDPAGKYQFVVDFRNPPWASGQVQANVFDENGNEIGTQTLPVHVDPMTGNSLVELSEEKMIMEIDVNNKVVNIYPLVTYRVAEKDDVVVSSMPGGRSLINYRGLDGQTHTVVAQSSGKEQVLVDDETQANGKIKIVMMPDGNIKYEVRNGGYLSLLFDPSEHIVVREYYLDDDDYLNYDVLCFDSSGNFRYTLNFIKPSSGNGNVQAAVFGEAGNRSGTRTLPVTVDPMTGNTLVKVPEQNAMVEINQSNEVIDIAPSPQPVGGISRMLQWIYGLIAGQWLSQRTGMNRSQAEARYAERAPKYETIFFGVLAGIYYIHTADMQGAVQLFWAGFFASHVGSDKKNVALAGLLAAANLGFIYAVMPLLAPWLAGFSAIGITIGIGFLIIAYISHRLMNDRAPAIMAGLSKQKGLFLGDIVATRSYNQSNPVANALFKHQDDIFGLQFNMLKKIEFRVGKELEVFGYNIKDGRQEKALKQDQLNLQDVKFVIEASEKDLAMIRANRSNDQFAIRDLAQRLDTQLQAYASDTRDMAANQVEVDITELYGPDVRVMPLDEVVASGSQLSAEKFYRTQNGDNIAVPTMALWNILDQLRRTEEKRSLWAAVAPRLDRLFRSAFAHLSQSLDHAADTYQGKPGLAAMIIQGMETSKAHMAERGLKKAAVLAELNAVIGDRDGSASPELAALLAVPEITAMPEKPNKVYLQLSEPEKDAMRDTISQLKDSIQSPRLKATLDFLETEVLPFNVLTDEKAVKLQMLLANSEAARPEVGLAPYGRGVSYHVTAMSQGIRVENVIIGKVMAKMAVPQMRHIFSMTAAPITAEALQASQQIVGVVAYNGDSITIHPLSEEDQQEFNLAIGTALGRSTAFRAYDRLALDMPIAQAFYALRHAPNATEKSAARTALIRAMMLVLQDTLSEGDQRRFTEAVNAASDVLSNKALMGETSRFGAYTAPEGKSVDIEVPESMPQGIAYQYSYLWYQASGTFTLTPARAKIRTDRQLKYFRMNTAA